MILLYLGMIVGNGLFTLGIDQNDFITMLIGRCIYGISAESFAMAETPLLYEYFWGKELSFALGFNLSFSRLGSAANDVITYQLYQSHGVVFSIAMGAFVLMPMCLLLLSVVMAYRVFVEHKTDALMSSKRSRRGNTFSSMSSTTTRSTVAGSETKSDIGMTTTLIKENGHFGGESYDATNQTNETMTSFNEMDMSAKYEVSMASKYEYSFSSRQNPANEPNRHYRISEDIVDESEINSDVIYNAEEFQIDDPNRFRFSDFKRFDTRFWLLVVNCCFQYGAVVPWMKIGGSYMQVGHVMYSCFFGSSKSK